MFFHLDVDLQQPPDGEPQDYQNRDYFHFFTYPFLNFVAIAIGMPHENKVKPFNPLEKTFIAKIIKSHVFSVIFPFPIIKIISLTFRANTSFLHFIFLSCVYDAQPRVSTMLTC